MRKILAVTFALVMVSVMVVPTQAQAPASYESTVNLTNLTDTAGSLTLTYYNPDGSVEATASDTIAAYETKWYTTLPGLTTSFQGSMVISSSVQLGSMSTIIGKDGSSDPMNYASYIGTSGGAGTAYLPLLMDSNYGFNTYYSVQNTSSSPVDVTITYSDGVVVSPITALQPNASVTIDNQAEAHTAKKFSAILAATGNIAVAVVETGDGSYGKPLYSYGGFGGGSTNPIFPMVNENNYGYWTAVLVQNLGGTATDVTLTYTPTKAGTSCTETQNIPAGESREFATFAFKYDPSIYAHTTTTDCVMGETFVGGAVVTTNTGSQALVGIVNQLNNEPGTDKGAALMSQNETVASDTIIFPDLRQWHGTWDWWSAWTIINVSGSTLPIGDIDCHVVGSDGGGPVDTHITNPVAIPNGGGWLKDFYQGYPPLGDGFVGGAVCTSASGLIVGTLNNLGHNAPSDIDSLIVYEGINP